MHLLHACECDVLHTRNDDFVRRTAHCVQVQSWYTQSFNLRTQNSPDLFHTARLMVLLPESLYVSLTALSSYQPLPRST